MSWVRARSFVTASRRGLMQGPCVNLIEDVEPAQEPVRATNEPQMITSENR
jgi:hypothetical protein